MRVKRIASVLLTILLIPSLSSLSIPLPDCNLIPESNASGTVPDMSFKCMYDVVCAALLMYKLDAVERASKSVVRETLRKKYDGVFVNFSGVRFDLDKMDFMKKGWTRYYPFYVDDKPYIIRIFRTEESVYQLDADVLYEGALKNPQVTFQILPGINALLAHSRITPAKIAKFRELATSP